MRESLSKVLVLERERENLKKSLGDHTADIKDLREKLLKKENECRHLKGDFKNMSQDCAKLNSEIIDLKNTAKREKKDALGESAKKSDRGKSQTLTQIQRELFDATNKIRQLDEKLGVEKVEGSRLKKEVLN